MLIRELVTRLGFDVDLVPLDKLDQHIADSKEGLEEMGAAADEAVQQVRSALATIRNLLIGFTVATAASGTALVALVKSAANVGDEVGKTAPILGMTTEEFQKYRYAAKLGGVENENFAGTIQHLLRNIAEARDGSKEATAALAKLGLTAADFQGLSTAEILRLLSQRLHGIQDEATRLSISMDLMGRSGARMGAFLAKGTDEMDAIMADVEAFGMFSAESAAQAEALNDAFDRVLFFIRGIKNEFGTGLFPVFTEILDQTREWLSLHRETIRSGIVRFVEILTGVIQKAWAFTKRVVNAFETMIRALGGLENAFYLLGIAILAPIIMLLGPVAALAKATLVLLVPFIRLHTVITLVSFAISALMPIFSIFVSAVAALAVGKALAWLVALAGGYKALAAAIIIPTAALLAQAAALALVILFFEDLTTFFLGGKTVIGEWLGEWEKIPTKLRAIWTDIKAIFASGGKFMAAVFRGDFREAYKHLQEGMAAASSAGGKATDLVTGGRGFVKLSSPRKGSLPPELDFMRFLPGGSGFAPGPYAMAGGPAVWNPAAPGPEKFYDSFSVKAGKNGEQQIIRDTPTVSQSNKIDVHVNLPKGTPREHAEETAKVFKELMDQQVNHSLQQSVAPGK